MRLFQGLSKSLADHALDFAEVESLIVHVYHIEWNQSTYE